MSLRRILFSLLVCALAGPAQAFKMPPPVVVSPGAGGVRVTADGLLANYYPPKQTPAAAILLLGGSEGGLGCGAAEEAQDLAAQGFAVMQLAYYGAPGLPSALNMVPLEYFDRAIGWLGKQPGVDAHRMAVFGTSKGAEAALLIASRHPELRAVVADSPSAVVWQGIDFSGGKTSSSWSLSGKPIAYQHYAAGRTLFEIYDNGLKGFTERSPSAIPVGRIEAPALLVCGESDKLWPSCPMSETIADEMRRNGGNVTVLAYPNAGHAVIQQPPSPLPPVCKKSHISGLELGGTGVGVKAAGTDSWRKTIRFLDRQLNPGAGSD